MSPTNVLVHTQGYPMTYMAPGPQFVLAQEETLRGATFWPGASAVFTHSHCIPEVEGLRAALSVLGIQDLYTASMLRSVTPLRIPSQLSWYDIRFVHRVLDHSSQHTLNSKRQIFVSILLTLSAPV